MENKDDGQAAMTLPKTPQGAENAPSVHTKEFRQTENSACYEPLDTLEEKIEGFIKNRNSDYAGFWMRALPREGNPEERMKHHTVFQQIETMPKGLHKSAYGYYINWTEFDGVKYSFSILKSLQLPERLARAVKILERISDKYEDDTADETDRYIAKKLRQYFYTLLASPLFSLGDIGTYNRVAKLMVQNLQEVAQIVKEQGYQVYTLTWDSIGFECKGGLDEATKLLEIVNENVPFKMHMRFYRRFVHFENYLVYESMDGSTLHKKTNFNMSYPEFEEHKRQIAYLLIKRKWKEAYELAKATKDAGKNPLYPNSKASPDRFRKEYISCLEANFPQVLEAQHEN